jgi:SAM-dependent methyltransferase
MSKVEFYERVVTDLMASGGMRPTDSVLVVCGGPYDAQTLAAAGCTQVTISNVDRRHTDYGAFSWSYQDAEALSLDDGSFDWAVVHAGLHHCASPHRAVLEMLRVARKGILLIEARDSALMRLAVSLGFTSDFEIQAVALEGGESGGVRNSAVPNFIYRWTERELRKTVESAFPHAVHELRFWYGLTLPTRRLAMHGPVLRYGAAVLGFGARCAHFVMPRMGNEFASAILKTGRVKPWMDESGRRMRGDYALGFDPARYKR